MLFNVFVDVQFTESKQQELSHSMFVFTGNVVQW